MMNAEEAIESFKKFEQRASAARSEQIDRIKEDRAFIGGDQWDKWDSKLVPKSRVRRVINSLSSSLNSVVNQYASYPYQWNGYEDDVNSACDAFLKVGSNGRAAYDVLYNAVAFGLGYFCLGSEDLYDQESGQMVTVPALYSVQDVENVLFDPDSVEIDGRDAMAAVVYEMKSKEFIKAKYGEEFVAAPGEFAPVNVSCNNNTDQQAIVTYFLMEDNQCSVYRLLGNRFLEEPVQLELSRVPVFPVYGQRTWNDGEPLWEGLIRLGKPLAKIINIAYTQLGERLAKVPKPTWKCVPESIENYIDNWRNAEYTLNPVLLWNDKNEDGTETYPEPKREDNLVRVDDVTGIISNNLNFLSTITGVDARGLTDNPEMTATEVIYNNKNILLTVSHYFENLKATYKACAEAVMQLLGYGRVSVTITQGPAELLEKQVARQQMVSMLGQVPDDMKNKMIVGILKTFGDNRYIKQVLAEIQGNPPPTQREMQAYNTVDQMKQAIDEKDQEILRLTQELQNYENGEKNQQRNMEAEFAKMQYQHQARMEELALQAKLNGNNDAAKAQTDAIKEQMALEKQAIELDTVRVRAQADQVKVAADVAKTVNSMVEPTKNDEVV